MLLLVMILLGLAFFLMEWYRRRALAIVANKIHDQHIKFFYFIGNKNYYVTKIFIRLCDYFRSKYLHKFIDILFVLFIWLTLYVVHAYLFSVFIVINIMMRVAIVVSKKVAFSHSALSCQKQILLVDKKYFNLPDKKIHSLRLSHSRNFQRGNLSLSWLLQTLVSMPTGSHASMGHLVSPLINLHDGSLRER